MPSINKIPERTEHVCEPCQYHKLTGALHVRCGEGGWREYACTHPESFPVHEDPRVNAMYERHKVREDGRHIGKTELQPDWCPLKRLKK